MRRVIIKEVAEIIREHLPEIVQHQSTHLAAGPRAGYSAPAGRDRPRAGARGGHTVKPAARSKKKGG